MKTAKHIEYWKHRKIDWKQAYLDTWNHPHRELLIRILAPLRWQSLFEVGCGPGPNLVKILQYFKNRQLGGMDVNEDAIKLASETFNGGHFKVGSAEDIMMSDNSVDLVLTDMCLIYLDDPKRAIREIKRIARNHIVFCELHSESLYQRLKNRYLGRYNIHNYKKLLEGEGFDDIILHKIPEEAWPGGEPQRSFGYIITAKVPKRK